MNRQKKFVEMMEALIGKSINLGDPIGQNKVELEASCAKLKDELGTEFVVNPNEGNEPCPFYCSSIDKPFDFVFIGMNPGKVLEAQKKLNLFSWENTTWQELADFCVPTDIHGKMNGYQLVKKNNVDSDYYKFFLRLHLALTGGEVFNTWSELKNRHANPEKFFIEHIASHSILNADLVPYKYKETPKFKITNLLKDPNYEKYFRQLIQFIEEETKPDAWIIFFGKTGYSDKGTRDLLEKFAPHWNTPKKDEWIPIYGINKSGEKSKKPNYFYFFHKDKQKILLSPFLRPDTGAPIRNHLNLLIDELKKLSIQCS